MKKRVAIIVMVLVLAITSLAACGQEVVKPSDANTSAAVTTEGTGESESAGKTDFTIGVLIFNYANDYISYVRKVLRQQLMQPALSTSQWMRQTIRRSRPSRLIP